MRASHEGESQWFARHPSAVLRRQLEKGDPLSPTQPDAVGGLLISDLYLWFPGDTSAFATNLTLMSLLGNGGEGTLLS